MPSHAVVKIVCLLSVIATLDDKEKGAHNAVTMSEVAGEYYLGDGEGVNCSLKIDGKGAFGFRWKGCGGEYGKNHGLASVADGHLILSPELPNTEGFGGTPTDFVIVQWGSRIYLIDKEQGQSFCNSVNSGFEPRNEVHGLYYVRRKDLAVKVSGKPNVPDDWRKWLLKADLKGVVTEVGATRTAVVNLGRKHGVFSGLQLQIDEIPLSVTVESVEEDTCVVRLDEFLDSKEFAFKKGQRVKSRLDWASSDDAAAK